MIQLFKVIKIEITGLLAARSKYNIPCEVNITCDIRQKRFTGKKKEASLVRVTVMGFDKMTASQARKFREEKKEEKT